MEKFAEKDLIENLFLKMQKKNNRNLTRKAFYDSKKYLDESRIVLPREHQNVMAYLSWSNIVVESLNEQLRLKGFRVGNNVKINQYFSDNQLEADSVQVHREAMIFGTSYVMIGRGDTSLGEPSVLISPESSLNCYGEINDRTRSLDNFIKVMKDSNGETIGFFYDKKSVIYFKIDGFGNVVETHREEHGLGIVPAVRFINRPSGSNKNGTSEISKSIISMQTNAQTTFTETGIARATYATPHRYMLNMSEDSFVDADGNVANEFDMYMSKMTVMTSSTDKNAKTPIVGQFAASSPEPFLAVIKAYALQITAETGIPESYFGYHSAQPASADAIRLQFNRLASRAEERSVPFGYAWKQVMRIASLIDNGEIPEGFNADVKPLWKQFGIPTPAASADAVVKLVSAGVLDAKSEVTAAIAGISPDDIAAMIEERSRTADTGILELLKVTAKAAEDSNAAIKSASDATRKEGNNGDSADIN